MRRFIVSGGICLALAASAVIDLPLPTAALEGRLAPILLEGQPGQVRIGSASTRWGQGRITLDDVDIVDESGFHMIAKSVSVQIGLMPLADDFLQLRGVRIHRPDVTFEPSFIERRSSSEGTGADVRVPVQVDQGTLHYRDSSTGTALSARIRRLSGLFDGDDLALSGVVEPPWGGALRFSLDAKDRMNDWQASFHGDAADVDLLMGDFLPGEWSDLSLGSLVLRTNMRGASARILEADIDLELQGLKGGIPEPAIVWEDVRLSARGELRDGIVLAVSGRAGTRDGRTYPLDLQGALRLTNDVGFQVRLDGEAGPIVLDETLQQQVHQIDASAGVAIDGFEPRGIATADLFFRWAETGGFNWAAYVPLAGNTLTYRGFLEKDGDKPSFPYPIHGATGGVALADSSMLVDFGGTMGTAAMSASGVLRLGVGPAGIAVDAEVDRLPVDAEFGSYLHGVPELAQLNRDLGNLDGGALSMRLNVRRKYMEDRARVGLSGTMSGTQVRPVWLPVLSRINDLKLEWTPGLATFQGTGQFLTGPVQLEGRIENIVDGDRPSIALRASGVDPVPTAEERKILESYLELPEDSAEFAIGPGSEMTFTYRRPGNQIDAQVLVRWNALDSPVVWEPKQLAFEAESVRASVFRLGEQTAISLPRAELSVDEGPVWLSVGVSVDAGTGTSRSLFVAPDLHFSPRLRDIMKERGLLESSVIDHLEIEGSLAVHLALDPSGTREASGLVELKPLTVRLANSERGEEARLRGPVRFDDGFFSSRRLHVSTASGELTLRGLRLAEHDDAWTARVEVESSNGIEVSDRVTDLVSGGLTQAIGRLEMSGRLGAQGVIIEAEMPRGEEPRIRASGKLLLRDMSMNGPPVITRGFADLVIEELTWQGPGTLTGHFRLDNGDARVSGLATRDAQGLVSLTPEAVELTSFRVRALGGQATTDGTGEDGESERGMLRVGLTPDAPIRALLFLEDMSLTNMRRELNLVDSLAGQVWGRLEFVSASPSPLDYTGSGILEIRDGALGNVPVLTDLWEFMGVSPPQFTTGRVKWLSNSETARGVVRIDEFVLDHPLLSVEGEGWVGLDGYLQMKATVRTFSIFGRLPLIGNLIDLIVRQNIRGPIDAPRFNQRALSELGGRDRRHPFPLWMPEVELPDWRRSPALPVDDLDELRGSRARSRDE